MENIETRLGNKIRDLRKQNKLSQERLSFISGLHRNYICDVEKGKRNISIENIDKLAKALKVSLEELFKDL